MQKAAVNNKQFFFLSPTFSVDKIVSFLTATKKIQIRQKCFDIKAITLLEQVAQDSL